MRMSNDAGLASAGLPRAEGTAESWSLPAPLSERLDAGRRLRRRLPRRLLGELSNGPRDPLGIIEQQNAGRRQDLVPLRTSRMSQSPFAFYRGTAAIMAADFSAEERSELLVPACGDAHLSNFGFYASPQRTLVFDLNDFDEAAWAPWEWDLKRLVASAVIAGQAGSRDEAAIRSTVLGAVRSYAFALRKAVGMSPRDRFYTHLDADGGSSGLHPQSQKVLRRAVKQAKKHTGERAARRLTAPDPDGRLRFIEQPPTMVRIDPELRDRQVHLVRRYLDTANADIRLLLRHYVVSDAIRRVVGVGSVGTRCALSLFQDGDGNAMILQSKEAGRSVLEQYGGIPQPRAVNEVVAARGEGARVVALQRVLQAVSDPFLGYLRFDEVDLYVRQFHDMKGGIDADELEDEPFETYSRACAVTLARAHGQSPLSSMISGYVGRGRRLGEVLLEWAYAYAARSRADYDAFVTAQTR
ncbi:hypothetical protein LEUCIP111803_00562 [Leucobacter soli]|uniref:DUF2252 domain-containing protein n=2 Tax=Leucobacter soli TaxID=2812850 RepID=A0A916NFR1_9MICO|nr:hypothetical protein LEUCIP111803_00562 [Leucobacter soli]